MADANNVKNTSTPVATNKILDVGVYPEVSVSIVHFLDDEVQIEQGRSDGEVDLNDGNNDLISMSPAQALQMAHLIIDTIGE